MQISEKIKTTQIEFALTYQIFSGNEQPQEEIGPGLNGKGQNSKWVLTKNGNVVGKIDGSLKSEVSCKL